MNYSNKEIAKAAALPDNLQFMQNVLRHHLQMHGRKFNGTKRFDLTSFALAITTSDLREFCPSLAALVAFFSLICINDLSHKI